MGDEKKDIGSKKAIIIIALITLGLLVITAISVANQTAITRLG